jgi:hypothetical protein
MLLKPANRLNFTYICICMLLRWMDGEKDKRFIANDRHSIYCISNGLHQDRLFRKNSQERILQQLEVKRNFFTRDSSVHKIEHNLINNNHVYTQEKWRSLQRTFNKKKMQD